jgi:hypothetical protein
MFRTGLTCNHTIYHAQKTPDSGAVSSVAYLAEKVSIDSCIVEIPYEATGTVGSWCLLHRNHAGISYLATVRVLDRDSSGPFQLEVGRTDALLYSRQISGPIALVETLSSAPLQEKGRLTCGGICRWLEKTWTEDQDPSIWRPTACRKWGGKGIRSRKTLTPHILQAHPHLRVSAENCRSQWRDREAVSVCQRTLARWREGRDPDHILMKLQ